MQRLHTTNSAVERLIVAPFCSGKWQSLTVHEIQPYVDKTWHESISNHSVSVCAILWRWLAKIFHIVVGQNVFFSETELGHPVTHRSNFNEADRSLSC
jgi:hypothetical protein